MKVCTCLFRVLFFEARAVRGEVWHGAKTKRAVVSDNRKDAYSSVSKHIYLQVEKCVSLGNLLVFRGFRGKWKLPYESIALPLS